NVTGVQTCALPISRANSPEVASILLMVVCENMYKITASMTCVMDGFENDKYTKSATAINAATTHIPSSGIITRTTTTTAAKYAKTIAPLNAEMVYFLVIFVLEPTYARPLEVTVPC